MALFFSAIVAKDLSVISSKDDSIAHVSAETYEEYLKSLDESLLGLAPDANPTRFVLKTVTSQKDLLAQKDSQTSVALKAKETGEAPVFTLMASIVRPCLKDMVTGGVSQIIKDKSGLASEEFMSWLIQTDIIADLYRAIEASKGVTDVELAKKN